MIEALGQLGPIGIALIVLLIMWALNRQSSKEYRLQIKSYREQLAEKDEDQDEVVAELKKELRELKNEIQELRAEMAIERAKRHEAEEAAHQLRLGGTP